MVEECYPLTGRDTAQPCSPTPLACSQGLIKYYTSISKSVKYIITMTIENPIYYVGDQFAPFKTYHFEL